MGYAQNILYYCAHRKRSVQWNRIQTRPATATVVNTMAFVAVIVYISRESLYKSIHKFQSLCLS